MGNTLFVHVTNGFEQNLEVLVTFLFGQDHIGISFKDLTEVLALDAFHDDIDLIRVYIALIKSTNIWVVELHQYFDFFSNNLLLFISIFNFNTDFLDGHVVRMLIRGKVDFSKFSISEDLVYLWVEIVVLHKIFRI